MLFRRLLRVVEGQTFRNYCKQEATLLNSVSIGESKGRSNSSTTCDESFSKLGDQGTSKTLSGEVLPKDNNIFKAIGATEELLSYIGLAREYAQESEHEYCDKLKRIQTVIIDISTAISRSTDKLNLKSIPPDHTKELEDWIHEYCKELPPPEQYIIPGGGIPSASLHIARAICRRTERTVVSLVNAGSLDKEAQVYLNRLSDFLFIVSRIAAKHDKRTESIYIPKPDEKVQAQ